MDCIFFRSVKNRIPLSESRMKIIAASVIVAEHRDGSLSIHNIGERAMLRMQKKYRGKHTATDVLSFSAEEGLWPVPGGKELGDIFMCPEKIKKQAREWETSYREEYTRMFIHGILHILGYDHISPREAHTMFAIQEQYLKKFL